MQVENIECQIAQAQIGHYLAGSGLSQEAMSQLEDHIAGCLDCKEALNHKRAELKAMLVPDRAAVDFEAISREAEATKANSFAAALRKKSLQQLLEPTQELPFVYHPNAVTEAVADQEPESVEAIAETKKGRKSKATKPATPATSWKPLVYSLALATVLIGMSMFSGNIAAILGPKLSETTTPVVPVTNSLTNSNPIVANSANPSATSTLIATNGSTMDQPLTTPIPPPSEPLAGPIATKTPAPVQEDEAAKVESNLGLVAGSIVSNSLGSSAGALATTQFATAEPEPPIVVPTPAKVITKAPAKTVVRKISPRRITRERQVRRATARPAAVRSKGIKVYNP